MNFNNQAARASDYAIGELLTAYAIAYYFHGKESYRKNSILILYNFIEKFIISFIILVI